MVSTIIFKLLAEERVFLRRNLVQAGSVKPVHTIAFMHCRFFALFKE
jgi:hypothetical protein